MWKFYSVLSLSLYLIIYYNISNNNTVHNSTIFFVFNFISILNWSISLIRFS
jgi:hypothetical protein